MIINAEIRVDKRKVVSNSYIAEEYIRTIIVSLKGYKFSIF